MCSKPGCQQRLHAPKARGIYHAVGKKTELDLKSAVKTLFLCLSSTKNIERNSKSHFLRSGRRLRFYLKFGYSHENINLEVKTLGTLKI